MYIQPQPINLQELETIVGREIVVVLLRTVVFTFLIFILTNFCPRSSAQFYMLSYYIKWFATSWTCSISYAMTKAKAEENQELQTQIEASRNQIICKYEVSEYIFAMKI